MEASLFIVVSQNLIQNYHYHTLDMNVCEVEFQSVNSFFVYNPLGPHVTVFAYEGQNLIYFFKMCSAKRNSQTNVTSV